MNHRKHKSARYSKKGVIMLLSLVLVAALVAGGTLAYLFTNTNPVVNEFTPASVDCAVTEEFDGTVKKNVNVTNTGETDAYIRVKLLSYRVNAEGKRIGGIAEVPEFTPGTGWVKHTDGFYYYTSPVASKAEPASDLIGENGIELTAYDDVDGGYQVVEVIAEAIQAEGVNDTGVKAVFDAWKVDPATLGGAGA